MIYLCTYITYLKSILNKWFKFIEKLLQMRKKDLKAGCIGKGGMFGDQDLFETEIIVLMQNEC